MGTEIQEVRRTLAAGLPVPDAAFDAHLPEAQRLASARFWTPATVALRMAHRLTEAGATRVLDFGSGAGKACVVGALASPLTFLGVEHRPHLVPVARALADAFGVADRVTFEAGGFEAAETADFDALYLFNPFGEHQFTAPGHLDETVPFSRRGFEQDVARLEHLLRRASVGLQLVTYNGFGGRIPDTFDLLRAEVADGCPLRHWRKARGRSAGGYWLELEDATLHRRLHAEDLSLPLEPEATAAPQPT
ncbi:MAG TPA: methyltransferase domain-containing protein [Holophagaceae bacterium]|nr:methyltransferase domain-containing protein [Holophagaceae bacterium]